MTEAIKVVKTMFANRELINDNKRCYTSYVNPKGMNYIIGFELDGETVYYGLTKVSSRKTPEGAMRTESPKEK